jgi:predicted kinase
MFLGLLASDCSEFTHGRLTPARHSMAYGRAMPVVVHLVFGPQGAGKSTYARELATRVGGVRLSIDEWMGDLFGPDLTRPLNFAWIMARVQRCEQRIWVTASAIAVAGGSVVLDLGFMKVASRTAFRSRAEAAGLSVQLYVVSAPHELRRRRVLTRNTDQGATFSFEVTPTMFDVMEREFEPPTAEELAVATAVETGGGDQA